MRPDNGNERDLITRAKKGDMDAFESLVRKYQRTVYVLCHHITGAHQTADDLSQDTFIKAYLALPHFIDDHAFFPWIRRIALNNCFNYLKKRKRERPLAEEEKVARHGHVAAEQGPEETQSPDGRIPGEELMRHRKLQDLLGAFLDNELQEKEMPLVEEHLRACRACREELGLLKKLDAL